MATLLNSSDLTGPYSYARHIPNNSLSSCSLPITREPENIGYFSAGHWQSIFPFGNAERNAYRWLKFIWYSLSVCALDRVSSVVPHSKSTGRKSFCQCVHAMVASFLDHIRLHQRWHFPDDHYNTLMDLFPYFFKIKFAFTRADEESDNWADQSYWPVYFVLLVAGQLSFRLGSYFLRCHWLYLITTMSDFSAHWIEVVCRFYLLEASPSLRIPQNKRKSFLFRWCALMVYHLPLPFIELLFSWNNLNDPICRVQILQNGRMGRGRRLIANVQRASS